MAAHLEEAAGLAEAMAAEAMAGALVARVVWEELVAPLADQAVAAEVLGGFRFRKCSKKHHRIDRRHQSQQ